MKRSKWKQFSDIVEFPYNKRFSTDGWGDFRIDSKGLYCYEHKCYSDEMDSQYVEMFLDGYITPFKGDDYYKTKHEI